MNERGRSSRGVNGSHFDTWALIWTWLTEGCNGSSRRGLRPIIGSDIYGDPSTKTQKSEACESVMIVTTTKLQQYEKQQQQQ